MSSADFGPLHPPEPIDAEYAFVGGPLRVGDEHPTNRGWYYTGRVDTDGDPLWYHPPPRWRRRARLIGEGAFIAMFLLPAIGLTVMPGSGEQHADMIVMWVLGLASAAILVPRWKEPFNFPHGASPSRRW